MQGISVSEAITFVFEASVGEKVANGNVIMVYKHSRQTRAEV